MILSPIDGTVHQQSVHGSTDVVKAGEALISIVPDDVRLVAEIKVTNQDLSYIQRGQKAAMRLDAYPFFKNLDA